MKKLVLFLGILFFGFTYSQVNWLTMEQAIEAQQKNPKKIIVDFYADWCGPCKLMEKQTYNNLGISKLINENYYAVKFNAEGNETVNFYGRTFVNPEFLPKTKGRNSMHQFAKFMNINAYPTLIFLDEKAQPITNLMGFFTSRELEPYLTMIATDEHKNIKTREEWENYQKKFKSKIKE